MGLERPFVPGLAAATVLFDLGEGCSNPSPWKRQFTLDQVPNGGGGQSYIASPEVQVKGLPALECRSFKFQNDGPLRFGRMFPGWNLCPT